jgi:hypothetical protein
MVGSSALDDQVIRVLDADGTPLTTAMTRAEETDGAVSLTEVEAPGILLDYYFGRGERLVVMELAELSPPLMIEGSLETWWVGGTRIWQIYVDRPLVTLGPVGSAEPEPAAGHLVSHRTSADRLREQRHLSLQQHRPVRQ